MYSCPKCVCRDISIEKRPNGDSVCLECRYKSKSYEFYEVAGEGFIEIERVIICLNCKKMYDYTKLDLNKLHICPNCGDSLPIFSMAEYLVQLLLKDLKIKW